MRKDAVFGKNEKRRRTIMMTSIKGVVQGDTVLLNDGSRLSRFDGSEVTLIFQTAFSEKESVRTKDEIKNSYPEDFWNLFGADNDSDIEIPEELDFAMDAPRAVL